MSEFTPGPWGINKHASIGAGKFFMHPIVAHIEPFYGDDGPGSHTANARLIAAAPTMYAALRGMLEYYHSSQISAEKEEELTRAMFAALADADGQDAEAKP